MTTEQRILVVSDNEEEFQRLKLVFAGICRDWQIEFQKDLQGALFAMSQCGYDVVFVDMSGNPLVRSQLLHQLWERYPTTLRYVLVDPIEPDALTLYALGAPQKILKPVQPTDLQQAMARAAMVNGLIRNKRCVELVSKMRTFATRPALYSEILKELHSPTGSARRVGELVSQDFACSTKLLQVVNSAYYGSTREVNDPGDAVLFLGLQATATLVLSIEAFNRIDQPKRLYFSMDAVWRHSMTIAEVAKKTAETVSQKNPQVINDSFTAGLLHDIGEIALACNFEEKYRWVLEYAKKNDVPVHQVEKEVFGGSHAEVGAYLLALWGMPTPIIEAVAAHHLPPSEIKGKFSAITAVNIAERLQAEEDLLMKQLGAEADAHPDYPKESEVQSHWSLLKRMIKGGGVDAPDVSEKDPAASTANLPITSPKLPPSRQVVRKVAPQWVESGKWAAAVVLPVVLIYGAYSLGTRTSKNAHIAGAAAEPVAQIAPASEPAHPGRPEFSTLKLQLVSFSGGNPYVVINGRAASVGDEVEGRKILLIARDHCVLREDGISRVLFLK